MNDTPPEVESLLKNPALEERGFFDPKRRKTSLYNLLANPTVTPQKAGFSGTPETNGWGLRSQCVFNKLMMKKTGEERLRMGFSMFEMARKQVFASILNQNPNADPKEIRKQLFLRFYGERL